MKEISEKNHHFPLVNDFLASLKKFFLIFRILHISGFKRLSILSNFLVFHRIITRISNIFLKYNLEDWFSDYAKFFILY
jgi:hypothetical protein